MGHRWMKVKQWIKKKNIIRWWYCSVWNYMLGYYVNVESNSDTLKRLQRQIEHDAVKHYNSTMQCIPLWISRQHTPRQKAHIKRVNKPSPHFSPATIISTYFLSLYDCNLSRSVTMSSPYNKPVSWATGSLIDLHTAEAVSWRHLPHRCLHSGHQKCSCQNGGYSTLTCSVGTLTTISNRGTLAEMRVEVIGYSSVLRLELLASQSPAATHWCFYRAGCWNIQLLFLSVGLYLASWHDKMYTGQHKLQMQSAECFVQPRCIVSVWGPVVWSALFMPFCSL